MEQQEIQQIVQAVISELQSNAKDFASASEVGLSASGKVLAISGDNAVYIPIATLKDVADSATNNTTAISDVRSDVDAQATEIANKADKNGSLSNGFNASLLRAKSVMVDRDSGQYTPVEITNYGFYGASDTGLTFKVEDIFGGGFGSVVLPFAYGGEGETTTKTLATTDDVAVADSHVSALKNSLTSQLKRDLYTAFGAVWNESTGYWELNGLTDITEAQMDIIFVLSHDFRLQSDLNNRFLGANFRTNLWPYKETYKGVSLWNPNVSNTQISALNMFRYTAAETLKIAQYQKTLLTYLPRYNDCRNMFYGADKLTTIVGGISLMPITSASLVEGMFSGCTKLEQVYVCHLNVNLSLADSENLNTDSVLYMIENSQTNALTITLHHEAFSNAVTNSDIHTALKAHTNVTLSDGSRTANSKNVDQWQTDDNTPMPISSTDV